MHGGGGERAAGEGPVNTPGLRLSCQLQCEGEMTVKAISRLAGSGLADAGKRPADLIEPPAMWLGGKPG